MAGVAGAPVTGRVPLAEPHSLLAITAMLPPPKLLLKSTRMELVPCPDEMVAPEGTRQLYSVSPVDGIWKFTLVTPHKPVTGPLMIPTGAGAPFTMDSVE